MTLDRDMTYLNQVEQTGKTYMAPVSPWCMSFLFPYQLSDVEDSDRKLISLIAVSTHFGKEVSYSKNWVFYSEMLWKIRWDQILTMGDKLNFIESK